MFNLDSILKSRDITLPTKVRLVKSMVLPVVMYGCESWTVRKAECQRIDASELWCWRRLLRVPWTARRSNQSRSEERRVGKECKQEEEEMTEAELVGWHHQLSGHESEKALGDGEGQRSLVCCSPCGLQRVGHD